MLRKPKIRYESKAKTSAPSLSLRDVLLNLL